MTFDEIAEKLPNGFHDIAINGINIELLTDNAVTIAMDIHVGEPSDDDPERYRSGRLRLISPYFFFITPPDPRYNFILNGSPINASNISMKIGEDPEHDLLLQHIPPEASAFGFFLDDLNSYIYLAGEDAQFVWDDGQALG